MSVMYVTGFSDVHKQGLWFYLSFKLHVFKVLGGYIYLHVCMYVERDGGLVLTSVICNHECIGLYGRFLVLIYLG